MNTFVTSEQFVWSASLPSWPREKESEVLTLNRQKARNING